MARLLALLLLALAATAAPAAADVPGIVADDGNRACADGEIDWDCLDVAVTSADDAAGSADVVIAGKENEPGGWNLESGGTNGKTDFAEVLSAVRGTPDDSYLYLGFERTDSTGSNVSVSFELNQSRARFVNEQGDSVPCRRDGDVLIAFDGSGTVALTMHRWVGTSGPAECPTGAAGTWVAGSVDGSEGRLQGSFGEAAIDLDAVATGVGITAPCEYFTSLNAHSRESASTSSQLGDYVTSQDISAAACKDPGGGEPPTAPTVTASAGCNSGGSVTLAGTADADTVLVQVREGDARLGQAAPDAEGNWTLTLTAVADGEHAYSAIAFDEDANASPAAAASASVDATAPAIAIYGAAGGPDAFLAGVADPGATVDVFEGATKVATATADGEGRWSVRIAAPAGEHTYTARTADECAANSAGPVTVTVGATGTPGGDGDGGGDPDGGEVLPGADECLVRPFRTFISKDEKKVRRATFFIDGKKVKTVRRRDRAGRFSMVVQPAYWRGGTHRITAKLKIKGRKKLRKVKLRTFTVCDLGKCVSRRVFKIRVKEVPGDAVVRASVRVNGKKVKTIRGARRLKAKIDLRGLPKGVVVVKIRAITASGKVERDTRRYRTCGLKKTAT